MCINNNLLHSFAFLIYKAEGLKIESKYTKKEFNENQKLLNGVIEIIFYQLSNCHHNFNFLFLLP
jgi:hypothetical protein